MKNVLVLDFDGLICDGLNECILVTWNGHHAKPLSAFSDKGFNAIPNSFVKRFEECRNFSKHLGHFLVPLIDQTTPFPTQDAFNAVYNSISEDTVNEFVKKVTVYRQLVRTEKKAYWLACHTFYNGLDIFLYKLSLPAYIVTAKDAESVSDILLDKSIPFVKEHIFGEQRSKLVTLTTIAQMEQIPNSQLYFFDDNINNVLEARNAGFQAYWATWGYNSPDHFHFATMHHIPSISLADFLTNRFGFPFFASQEEFSIDHRAGTGFESIIQLLMEQKRMMEALEAENDELRRQLTNLRQGIGITLVIDGKAFSLASEQAPLITGSTAGTEADDAWRHVIQNT